jgi:ubiquitin carboxyl-terminal hydrolase 9/24
MTSYSTVRPVQLINFFQENKVLTIALEGNIDQVQYTDRIKSIVEFLGPRLSLEELTKMWNLQVTKQPILKAKV